MRTVTPRFQVRHLGQRGHYTVLDNDTGALCGTNNWPDTAFMGILGYAAMLNEAYKYVPRFCGCTTADENSEEP